MRGDVLLYRTGGILKDRVVCAYTGGPFCHCEIDLGDGATLGAHSEDGVSRRPEAMLDRKVVISLQGRTSPERIEAGIAWALGHVGEPFSWASIADLVLPTWVSTLLFGRRSVYNCASLVARYLEIAGGLDLPSDRWAQALSSPNAIARAWGLLPETRGLARSSVVRLGACILAMAPMRQPRQARSTAAMSPPCRD
jgi:uncharacterized protein YycO